MDRQAGQIEPYNNMMVARATIPGTAAAGQMVVGYIPTSQVRNVWLIITMVRSSLPNLKS